MTTTQNECATSLCCCRCDGFELGRPTKNAKNEIRDVVIQPIHLYYVHKCVKKIKCIVIQPIHLYYYVCVYVVELAAYLQASHRYDY